MKYLFLILAITILGGCRQSSIISKNETFANFINLSTIDKAEVQNNHGAFLLNIKQLNNLKTALKKLSYEPNQDIKVGAKAVTLFIKDKKYTLITRTNGDMAEITIDNQTLVFKMNGLNLDNYEKN